MKEDKINTQSPNGSNLKGREVRKKTLKQLEDDLEYYKSFIGRCVESKNVQTFNLSFGLKGKHSVSYEDIQELPLEERYSWAMKLINDKDFFNGKDGESEGIHKAIRVLYLLGFRELAAAVDMMAVDYSVSKYYQPKIEDIQAQIKHKKMTSKGGKGRTSRHKDIALQIAEKTWHETPGASMASLSKKIHAYLDRKHTDVPETETIEKWLKDSGLNPNISPKVRNYDLVV
ncbi:hypothetical protein [Serratia marcescens]|uniref:Uncharacterized protein n=1 Tax=Serratia marcescens TaxID=615 RepID=A0A9X8VM61_SERMA|nr:hypothetical protein [Serratia marcescens]MBS3890248.1 hypothetical protein [Serratia marcescens]